MTRYVHLVEGEDWLKQFENRRKLKLSPFAVFMMGAILSALIAGATWFGFG
jgi:hypothetical protein